MVRNSLWWKSDQAVPSLKKPSVAGHCSYNKFHTCHCSLEGCGSVFPVGSLLFLQPCPLTLLAVTQFLKHIQLFPSSEPVHTQFCLLREPTPPSVSGQTPGLVINATPSEGLSDYSLYSRPLSPLFIFVTALAQLTVTLFRYLDLVCVCLAVSFPVRM